jgi:hypothetical protein
VSLRDEAIRAAKQADEQAKRSRAETERNHEAIVRHRIDEWAKKTHIPVRDVVVLEHRTLGPWWGVWATFRSEGDIRFRAHYDSDGPFTVTLGDSRINSIVDLGRALSRS